MHQTVQASDNASLEARRSAVVPRGAPTITGRFVHSAKNAVIHDVEGRRLIDFAGGIGVLNTGHLHPHVQAAAQAQLTQFAHTCYTVAPYESYVQLAERLVERTPISGAKKALLVTTGVEAVENAVKIARAATGRSALIAFGAAFHGRTLLGMALTAKVAPYKDGFGPFPAEVYHVPFPTGSVTAEASIAAIEDLFSYDVPANRVAAIIIEPVQGEGGFNVASPAFMQALRALCDAHGILLIADEIQSGFARTGKWFAVEHAGVEPDLMTMAKSLAGGFPLAAVVGRAALMDAPVPGGLGGTYAGNPVSIAAANAVIDVIEGEGLLERSALLGERLRTHLHGIENLPELAEVRGLGSMIAADFRSTTPAGQKPNADFAKAVQKHALDLGLILLTCGQAGSAIRFLYPLTIEDEVFAEALAILTQALRMAQSELSGA
ncbi:4-aminobutyrate--2-oxoglutarate transaminase [Pseudomonas sp. 02C 26]|uniref:4-aminobutyrate--2-oxoglutarate transaminase n=1 Tax=Pseudomonas sp. 02C 26 TaxID=2054914 RepID=UPI000C6E80AD|nr:4-aminobutyrate--2-oxoglutarate transaminase [Pseudomonas sp. 02C 26]AUF98948.1 4-aminobutyrate--2-oxoglutarate transaminase [Pseudomonas sp. 02C 26]